MAYIKNYINYEDYLCRYNGADGKFYTGFVVGYGYVYPKAGVIYPPHLNGFGSGSGNIPMDQTHNTALWQQVEDRTLDAVNQSYEPMLDELKSRIIKDNGDNTISVNMGFNKYIVIPKEASSQIEIRIGDTQSENPKLSISLAAKDDLGNGFQNSIEYSLSDMKHVFGSDLPATYERYELDKVSSTYNQAMTGLQLAVGGTTEILEGIQNINSNKHFWRQRNGMFRMVKNIDNNFLLQRNYELSQARKATSSLGKAAKVLGRAGVGLTIADVVVQGAMEPSHAIGLGLFVAGSVAAAAGLTVAAGAIAVVGTVYFVVDVGFMIFSEKSLSERIDDKLDVQWRLWDSLLPTEDKYKLQPVQ